MRICIIILCLSVIACTPPITAPQDVYARCVDSEHHSIVRFIAQYQVLNDRSSKQIVELFDQETSKVESVNLCECVVTKLKRLTVSQQQRLFTRIDKTDHELAPELKIYFKHGFFGKFKYEAQYIKIDDVANKLTELKRIIAQASYDKFEHQSCQ